MESKESGQSNIENPDVAAGRDDEGNKLPLSEGDVFWPENELLKIRQAPSKERSKLLREFKEKLTYQKEGLAKIQEQIVEKIRKNPDAPLGDLLEFVGDLGLNYGLTGVQKELANDLLRAYAEKHACVQNVREQYPDDEELYCALFGRKPRGSLEVVAGPITLSFQCKDIEDYAYIYGLPLSLSREITRTDIVKAAMSDGVYLRGFSPVPGLEGTIIALNSSDFSFPSIFEEKSTRDIKKMLEHEEQHALNQFFGVTKKEGVQKEFRPARTEKERWLALKSGARVRREENIDERAKSEIIARFKSGESPEEILLALKDPLYDQASLDENPAIDHFTKVWGKKFEPEIKKAIEEAYGREYQNLLSKSVGALDALGKNGYSAEQIIAILIQEPLVRWEKVARRLTEKQVDK